MKPQLEYMLKQVEEGRTHFRKEIKMKLKECYGKKNNLFK